jgi:RimJ/RimL family protein N-acetyltransferase
MSNDLKVKLTELRPSDAEVLFRWINDPDLVRLHGPYHPVDWAGHLSWMGRVSAESSQTIFAIRLSADGAPIGILQFKSIHPVHRSAELFIRIGSAEARGKGYGTEALREGLTYAFGDLNLERVFLHVFHDNALAIRAYEKVGFAVEGRLRRAAFIGGEWKDVLVMAHLRSSD